jgi:DNA helicase-2/ATP-dependent DNA helicase PcrA
MELQDSEQEALFIASEIIRLINLSQGLLEFSHFAILVRTTMLTRVLEQIFTYCSIPYRVVGDLRYFETAEIKDLLAYLNFIHNPSDISKNYPL